MTVNECMEWLVYNGICTQEEYNLVSDINGNSMNTINDILYARTGYRSIEQMTGEDEEEDD